MSRERQKKSLADSEHSRKPKTLFTGLICMPWKSVRPSKEWPSGYPSPLKIEAINLISYFIYVMPAIVLFNAVVAKKNKKGQMLAYVSCCSFNFALILISHGMSLLFSSNSFFHSCFYCYCYPRSLVSSSCLWLLQHIVELDF